MSELTKLTTRTPTEAQLDAARDWSRVYVGAPIGNKAATGCWQAMFDALPISPAPVTLDQFRETIAAFSSPTVDKGDAHGARGQAGHILWGNQIGVVYRALFGLTGSAGKGGGE